MLLLTNNEDKQYSPVLSLLTICEQVWNIARTSPNQWLYDHETRDLERNDALWRRLFVSSNNESFDINTLWTSYARSVNNPAVKNDKNVRDIVNFSAPTVRILMEGECGQVLMSSTNNKV